MTLRLKLASLAFAAPIVCALAAAVPGTAFGQSAPQEGLWKEGPHKLALKIEVEPNNELIIRQANPNDCCNLVGTVVGEAHPRGPDLWIGRHLWGGPKKPPRSWGEPGGLLIRRINDDTILVVYRDSKYSGGWLYKKTDQP
jgi:hypothetical protein